MPALLEAFDSEGKAVDRAELKVIPARKVPGEPIPIFEMTVSAERIAYIEFSGPREGEILHAELRHHFLQPVFMKQAAVRSQN